MTRMLAFAFAIAVTQAGPAMHRISGRVQDAHGQRPPGVTLSVCRPNGKEGTSCGDLLTLAADGSFTSPLLPDGSYFLEAGPSPYERAGDPAVERGTRG